MKGGEKGANEKSGQWTQPKGWDWSVTTSPTSRVSTGRLIPVSEATDDLPTPGYKMSDLQQRVLIVPSIINVNQAPILKEVSDNNTQSLNLSEDKKNEDQRNTTPNQPYNVNEGEVLQSLDLPQNISVVKETLSLETTASPETNQVNQSEIKNPSEPTPESSSQKDLENAENNKEPQEEQRVPVYEPPMVKVTLPEICSITGIGCRDQPTTASLDGEQSTVSATESGNKDLTSSTNRLPEELGLLDPLLQTTQGVSETTKRSVDSALNESTIYPSNSQSDQQTEKISVEFSASRSTLTSTNNVQSTERIESASTEKNDENQFSKALEEQQKENIEGQVIELNPQAPIHETIIPQQEQIEEAYIKKIGSFDNLEVIPVKETEITLDQIHLDSSTIEEQKPLDSKFERNPNDNNEEKGDSSEEDHKQDSSAEKNDDSSVEKDSSEESEKDDDKNTNGNNAEIEKPTEEEKKLIETHHNAKQNSTTEEPKDEQMESPSIGERITGYWRAATGFVSKALNI